MGAEMHSVFGYNVLRSPNFNRNWNGTVVSHKASPYHILLWFSTCYNYGRVSHIRVLFTDFALTAVVLISMHTHTNHKKWKIRVIFTIMKGIWD